MSNRLASILATGVACFLAYSCATGSTDTGDDPLPMEGTGGTSGAAGGTSGTAGQTANAGGGASGDTGSAGQSGSGA